jgi:hypothetical protein
MLFLRMKRICLSFFSGLLFVYLSAQVPVSKEPRHHVVFTNEKVRVLNVLLPPGDTTLYHLHSTPSVFIMLSATQTGSQLINEQATYSKSGTGSIFFENLSAPHTRTHRVWNTDTSTFHVVDVELLSDNPVSRQAPLIIPHVQVLTDTPWVTTYKIELKKTETVFLHEKNRSFVLIAISNTAVDIKQNDKRLKETIQAGGFLWLKPGDTISIKNQQNTTALFALLEIK